MPRYPKQPLEQKLAWMRERQRAKEEEARLKQEAEMKAQLMERAARLHESNGAGQVERPSLPSRRMLRVDEVAKTLRVSVTTVRRWFRHCAVIVHPGPRKTTMLISEQILDDWIAEHTAKRRR